MVKDPDSGYSPGRRGFGWLKMKKALATIDCVVVGVEVGHGKRHGVLSDYTFAVRDTATDRLVNIGKAYSGLTDAEIAEMTRWFEAHTIARYGRYHQVEPTVVVEIAFDVIVRSTRHGSGFSLRFPRIAGSRPDKTVDEIDTVETVTALYEGLQHGAELLVTAGSRDRPASRARLGDLAPRLAVDRQVQPVAPFGPAAVVDRDVLVAEQGQDERELGGGDARSVVADHPPAADDVGLVEHVAQLGPVAQALAAGLAGRPDRHVDRAGDVAEALRVALEAAVFRRRPRVDQGHVRGAEQAAHVGRRQPRPVGPADREPARGGRRHARSRPRGPRRPSPGSRRRGPGPIRARRRGGSTRRGPRTGPGCRRRPRPSSRR